MECGIMRASKMSNRVAIAKIGDHNERDEDYESRSNPDIDPTRTAQNYALIAHGGGSLYSRVEDRIKKGHSAQNKDGSTKAIRADAVRAVEMLFTFTSGAVQPADQRGYFEACLEWAGRRLGGRDNIVSAVVHMDETTPHLHLVAVPILDGRLNAKALIGGTKHRMRAFQDEFHSEVSSKWGLGRGEPVEHTKRHHLNTPEYKKDLDKKLEQVKVETEQEITKLRQEVEQAKAQAEREKAKIEQEVMGARADAGHEIEKIKGEVKRATREAHAEESDVLEWATDELRRFNDAHKKGGGLIGVGKQMFYNAPIGTALEQLEKSERGRLMLVKENRELKTENKALRETGVTKAEAEKMAKDARAESERLREQDIFQNMEKRKKLEEEYKQKLEREQAKTEEEKMARAKEQDEWKEKMDRINKIGREYDARHPGFHKEWTEIKNEIKKRSEYNGPSIDD